MHSIWSKKATKAGKKFPAWPEAKFMNIQFR